ncbi:hypothetical protein BP6252_00940 [Coleophoma cylindrospora]|uniref:Altered inheritance of mitochondria protein 21 n=1 Tax=Coleophoma cylindrospora TaxID=1849047 RepID=A0A3D8ST13_9HELO|nr:hypothetical protein BP6252_00940 [Coleophoma cylindrospora]
MSTAMPPVPPRPSRSQAQDQATLGSDIPKIPPRPTRRIDRSQSPNRESFARSPLNELPSFMSHKPQGSNLSTSSIPGPEPPARPPSVSLPSIGQEGSEYGEVFGTPEPSSSPTQTRNIANDLKLHAPKPSLPTLSAKQRVSAVTRTDSEQAASFGIGKAPADDKDPAGRPLRAKSSFASQTSNGTERPGSSHGVDEQGIPEIGQRVPMYPNAGDVQAPSPAAFATPYAPGIGFHNDGSKPRHHGRKSSGRGFEGPPGSYGLHGHGVVPNDRFEKAYYEKHPELFKKETGGYHGDSSRAEWAMSSDDLNKIVRDTASRGAGLGTSPALVGTPSEEIGFQATEEYASRMSSPKPQYQGDHSNPSQTHLDSPLRKASFPADAMGKAEFEGTLSRGLQAPSDHAFESEVEDEDTIHVDEPGRRSSKIYGSRFESVESLGVAGEEEEEHDDRGYSAPILAEDEVAKEPFGYELQPAVSPYNERRSGSRDDANFHHRSGSASSLAGSRPSSRPTSIHGSVFHDKDAHSTPLENLEEYEPLFPEDEKSQKPVTAADRLKRPELKNRKFPSQDVWEDAPNSLHYTATVSTPQLPEDKEDAPGAQSLHIREGETPEQAFARRQEQLAEEESANSQSFLQQEKKPWAHKSHLVAETRPGMKQRFPSRDIWEDTPDSLQLQTTVAGPQSDDKDILSPPDERPTTGAVVYHQEKAAAGLPLGGDEGRATTGIAATLKPEIPARPTKAKPTEAVAQPLIPNRPARKTALPQMEAPQPPLASKPKPAVPARPSKISRGDSAEGVPLAQVASNSSAKSLDSDSGAAAAAAKPKPPVPSRPMGSKIAALQGGFLSDLNKRLQLGPQAPKKEEIVPEQEVEVKEKAPLADARKGRARGPARRAPAKSPAPALAEVEKPASFGLSTPATIWHIHPDEGVLSVPSQPEDLSSVIQAEASAVPLVTTNTAGESLQDVAESSFTQEKSMPVPSEPETVGQSEIPDTSKDISTDAKQTGHESPLQAPHDDVKEEIEQDNMATSTATLKPSSEEAVE